MYVKKAMGKVYGADFTAAERKAMQIEIRKEMADFNRKNLNEIDAIILWWLHEKLGFGKKRILDFYKDFVESYEQLNKRYEMCDKPEDEIWLCTELLKRYGIDIRELRKEVESVE